VRALVGVGSSPLIWLQLLGREGSTLDDRRREKGCGDAAAAVIRRRFRDVEKGMGDLESRRRRRYNLRKVSNRLKVK